MIASCAYTTKKLAHFRLIVYEPQQCFTVCAFTAYAKDVFCGRIEVDDEQAAIKQDNAGVQAVQDVAGVVSEDASAGSAS